MSLAYFDCSAGTYGFNGIEWDLEYRIDRSIQWIDVVGFRPRPVELWLTEGVPQARDMVDATFTVWGSAADMSGIESGLPGYGPGNHFALSLPGVAGVPAVPGFGNVSGTNVWDLVYCTMNSPIESMGRKAPRGDLYG